MTKVFLGEEIPYLNVPACERNKGKGCSRCMFQGRIICYYDRGLEETLGSIEVPCPDCYDPNTKETDSG